MCGFYFIYKNNAFWFSMIFIKSKSFYIHTFCVVCMSKNTRAMLEKDDVRFLNGQCRKWCWYSSFWEARHLFSIQAIISRHTRYSIILFYVIDTHHIARDSKGHGNRDDYKHNTLHMFCHVMLCVFFPDMESHSIPASFRPQLHLIGLTFKDEGQYFCVARNSLGTDRSQPMLLNITCRFLIT